MSLAFWAGRSPSRLYPTLMISHATSMRAARSTSRDAFAQAFNRCMAALERQTLRCLIPQLRGLYERHPNMHYHFKPELFVQLGGYTDFSFPDEEFTLEAGEVCVVPRGMPHGERVRDGRERFENLVVSFYNDSIDIHLAHEALPGVPRADEVHFFQTDLYTELHTYLDRVAELHDSDARANTRAIRGLLLAEFALLATVVAVPTAHRPSTKDAVGICQWLIQHNLQEPDLCLESLADELDCSPNYLSKLFHARVGERLVEYINRLRVENAIDSLRHSRLSIKAVAAACGFRDANYFARVFRHATGRSPQEFRADCQRSVPLGYTPPVDTRVAHNVDETVTVENQRPRGCEVIDLSRALDGQPRTDRERLATP